MIFFCLALIAFGFSLGAQYERRQRKRTYVDHLGFLKERGKKIEGIRINSK